MLRLLLVENYYQVSDFGLCTTLSNVQDYRDSLSHRSGAAWRTVSVAEKFESWQKQRRELVILLVQSNLLSTGVF